jgi:transcription elongation factor GreA
MAKEAIELTAQGKGKIEKELEHLKGPRRAFMSEALREARSHGDLRENAAYDEAKLNQARLEGRIKDLEWILERAQIIERPDGAGAMLHLGSKVVVREAGSNFEEEFTLVGAFEADPSQGLISIISPIGKALIGREAGNVVSVEGPKGEFHYEIVAVHEPDLTD